jgi:DNA-binding IclR family transcriptional regulator
MSDPQLVQSLVRAFDILDCVAAAPEGARLSDIARQLALKVPTVHNLIRSLLERGVVEKYDDGRYYLGATVERLAQQRGQNRFMGAVEEALIGLALAEPDAVLNFSHPAGLEMVESRYWDPRRRILQQRHGVIHHPYASASGLAGQAYADATTLADLRLRQPFHEHGAHLWGTLDALTDFLAQVRATRVCHPAFSGASYFLVAVPLLGQQDEFFGVIGAALPPPHAEDPSAHTRLIARVTQAVGQITAAR